MNAVIFKQKPCCTANHFTEKIFMVVFISIFCQNITQVRWPDLDGIGADQRMSTSLSDDYRAKPWCQRTRRCVEDCICACTWSKIVLMGWLEQIARMEMRAEQSPVSYTCGQSDDIDCMQYGDEQSLMRLRRDNIDAIRDQLGRRVYQAQISHQVLKHSSRIVSAWFVSLLLVIFISVNETINMGRGQALWDSTLLIFFVPSDTRCKAQAGVSGRQRLQAPDGYHGRQGLQLSALVKPRRMVIHHHQ